MNTKPRNARVPVKGSPWMTIQQAAEHLGLGTDAIYEACASKGLKHARFGHSTIRIRVEWLNAWAEEFVKVNGNDNGNGRKTDHVS